MDSVTHNAMSANHAYLFLIAVVTHIII